MLAILASRRADRGPAPDRAAAPRPLNEGRDELRHSGNLCTAETAHIEMSSRRPYLFAK
jgi:hypothetical protein